MFCPTAWIVKYESAGFPIQLFLFEEFRYSHRLDGLSGSVGKKKLETLML
jgi:hypothetical protein